MKNESRPKLDALELVRIKEQLSKSVELYKESGDDMDECSWGMEYGVLVSANDASRIADAIYTLFGFLIKEDSGLAGIFCPPTLITDCQFYSCALNSGTGSCCSTLTQKCSSIPDQFNEDL